MLNLNPEHIKKQLFIMLMLIGMYNLYVNNGKIRPTIRAKYFTKIFMEYIKIAYLYLTFTRSFRI